MITVPITVGTVDEAGLFRRNSMSTRMLSAFARLHGYNYIRALLLPLINQMSAMPPGHSYELDPSRIREGESVEENEASLTLICQAFLDVICESVAIIPPYVTRCASVCAPVLTLILLAYSERFAITSQQLCRSSRCSDPHASMNSITVPPCILKQNMLPSEALCSSGQSSHRKFRLKTFTTSFDRFICPAIISPSSVDIELPSENQSMQRGLVLITKIIQNLANNILFGKEAFMTNMNGFLSKNIMPVTRFLSEILVRSAAGQLLYGYGPFLTIRSTFRSTHRRKAKPIS